MTKYMVVHQRTPKDRMFDTFSNREEATEIYSTLAKQSHDWFFLGLLSVEVVESQGRGRDLWGQASKSA